MTDLYYVLKIAEKQLIKDLAAADKALQKAKESKQRIGTIQTGATKKSYQKSSIRYGAACQHHSRIQDWHQACVKAIEDEVKKWNGGD